MKARPTLGGFAGNVVSIPEPLVIAIERAVAAIPAPLGKQIDALSELFRTFTSERANLRRGSYLDDPRFRAAYLRYHLPLNVARATWALGVVNGLHPQLKELRQVVDLGAGLGSASLATFLGLGGEVPRRYQLYDRSRRALKLARELLESCALGTIASITTKEWRLPSIPEIREPSIVWLSMVLNEMESRSREPDEPKCVTLHRLARVLPPRSVVFVIEPALREPGRTLLEFHDEAVASGAWKVLAPCPHQLQCPLLRVRDRTWCHFKLAWDAPPIVREVADPLGLDASFAALSYFVLERRAPGEKLLTATSSAARVIGDPMRLENGKSGVYVCHQGKRETTAVTAGVRRGDLLTGYSARQAEALHSSSPPDKSGAQPRGGARGRPPWKRKARR